MIRSLERLVTIGKGTGGGCRPPCCFHVTLEVTQLPFEGGAGRDRLDLALAGGGAVADRGVGKPPSGNLNLVWLIVGRLSGFTVAGTPSYKVAGGNLEAHAWTAR